MPKAPQLPSDRLFGYTFVIVLGLLAIWQGWAGRIVAATIFAALSGLILGVTLVRASLLNPLNRAWMKLGALLHAIVNPLVLGLGNSIAFWDCEKTDLVKDRWRNQEPSSHYISTLSQSLTATDPLSRIIQVELKNRLPELLFMRVDKMSMAALRIWNRLNIVLWHECWFA